MVNRISVIILLFLLIGCNRADYECSDCVVQYVDSDPKQLTPFNATDPTALVLFNHLFQTLLSFDFQTNKIIPILAKEQPKIKQKKDGKIEVDFEIRAEAKWNDGTEITGEDVAFSLKVIKCPQTDNQHLKSDFALIENIFIDKQNPKKFTLVYTESTMMLKTVLTDLLILPKQIYDVKGILDNYSLYEMTVQAERFSADINLQEFANAFNSPKFQREVIIGSGPYRLASWTDGERLVLDKKETWWGNEIIVQNQWFEAFPNELVFEVYKKQLSGYSALKKGKIDVMNDIPFYAFSKYWATADSKYQENYHILTAPNFSYDYIGINLNSPKLSDTLTRKALAHLMDIEMLIQQSSYGFAEQVTSFTHPSLEEFANKNIEPYAFNIALADSLLTIAGWQDLDSNNILEKQFITDSLDTITLELSLTICYNSGNERRKKAAQILQAAAKKVGVNIIIESIELANLLDKLKLHDFELYIGGWISSPKLSNPMAIWHTSAINTGSNYVSFGNEKSDAIVEKISREISPQKKAKLYQALHGIIHAEIPYIFLLSQKKCIAISKKFDKVYPSGMSPGYWSAGFERVVISAD
jgi:peptide/nickel transport system substrate-binding protein